jgi:hypothetical protein
MKNPLPWLGRNIDPILALIVALVVGSLEVFSTVPSSTVSSGILLVLGVLSVAVLRDRLTKDTTEQQLRAEVRRAGELQSTVGQLAMAVASMQATVVDVAKTLDDATMVRVLSGPELSRKFADARRNTDRWIFRGGTGTYIRAATLPECVANARRDRRTLQMRLEIIDPTDEAVCASYVRFRHSLEGDQSAWTMERTQRESYATIVAACWYRQRYELLDIEVGLSRVMPTLRWDMSADYLVVTQESPNNPALLTEHNKLLYTYVQTELRKSFEQARPVPLELVRTTPLSDMPTVEEVRRLFVDLRMPLPSVYTNRDIGDIVSRALRAENLYDQ